MKKHRSKYGHRFNEERFKQQTDDDWDPPPLTLEEARATDAFAVLWGEYGASIYLIAAARELRCTQNQLEDMLAMLDKEGWNDFGNAGIRYVPRPEATASVRPNHDRIGTLEIWIAQTLSHLAENESTYSDPP